MGRTWSSACPYLVFYKCRQVWMSFGPVEMLSGEFAFLECQQNVFKIFVNLQWDGSDFEILGIALIVEEKIIGMWILAPPS